MTRAQHRLQLLAPQRFHVTQQPAAGDRHLYAPLSRFVTPQVAALLERVASPGCSPGPAPGGSGVDPPHGAAAAIDVGARLRSLWD